MSPNGQYIAAGSRDGVLEIWLGHETRFWRAEEAHRGNFIKAMLVLIHADNRIYQHTQLFSR